MSLTSSDILFMHSTLLGSAGNSVVGTPGGSLGKYVSLTQIVNSTIDNLFDDVTGDENAASDVEYRCGFIRNAHATDTMIATVLWISAQVGGGANAAIGIDPGSATLIDSSSAQAVQIASENTAPVGVTFSTPVSKATALSMGDIPAGRCRAFWVRRTATNSAALSGDGASLRTECDVL